VFTHRHSPAVRWIATCGLFLAIGVLGSRPVLGDSDASGGQRAKLDRRLQEV